MCTCRSAMTAASAASLRESPWCSRHTSAIWRPTVKTDSKAALASWKHHADPCAANAAQSLFVQFGQVLAVEQDPPGRAHKAGRLDL